MKIRELLESIERSKKDYLDFLDWDIALEHVDHPERDVSCRDDMIKMQDFDCEWIFIKSHCMGCCTYFIKQKIFGIQIHY